MMKRFGNCGKIVGLMLLALGLVFAGCQGTGGAGSSSETAAPAATQNTYGDIPISIDGKTGAIQIGTGDGLSDLTLAGGHTVEIKNGDTSIVGGVGNCGAGGGTGDVKCWIKLVNKDSYNGMFNAYMFGSKCVNCGTGRENNGDFVAPGDTAHAIGAIQPDVNINGGGYCYAEDGKFIGTKAPFNQMACSTYTTPSGSFKPMQAIHPKCGARSELWDFGYQVSKYTFHASVAADWFPWNPKGNEAGGPAADGRYDFQNYSTIYMILTDLANTTPGLGRYNWGSWKRSTTLAGYGATGNVSSVNLTVGTYFGVNVAVEAPDRVENYYIADRWKLNHANNVQGYEYYWMGAIYFRYNPFVVERVRDPGNHSKRPYIKPGAQDSCSTPAFCNNTGNQSYSHLEAVADGTNSFYGAGWVALYRNIGSDKFKYYLSATPYVTDAGGSITFKNGNHFCAECGQKGFGLMNRNFLGKKIVPDSYVTGSASWTVNMAHDSVNNPAYTHDGPDPAPENTWMLYHFFVRNTAKVGQGSEFRADVFGSNTQFMWVLHQNKTNLVPGGWANGDYTQYCYPFFTGGGNVQFCQMVSGQPVMAGTQVFQSKEMQNAAIMQSGEGVQGGAGGVQSWNTYICVQ